MNDMDVNALREAIRPYMDERRYRHTLGVEREMRWLCFIESLTVQVIWESFLNFKMI